MREGKISLKNCGSIPLDLANLLDKLRPIKTDKAINNPYHLILKNPKFINSDPGDFKKAGWKYIFYSLI